MQNNKTNTPLRKEPPLAHRHPNPGNQRRSERLPIFPPRPPDRPSGRHIPPFSQRPPEKSAKKQDTHPKEYPIHDLCYCSPIPDPFLQRSRVQRRSQPDGIRNHIRHAQSLFLRHREHTVICPLGDSPSAAPSPLPESVLVHPDRPGGQPVHRNRPAADTQRFLSAG